MYAKIEPHRARSVAYAMLRNYKKKTAELKKNTILRYSLKKSQLLLLLLLLLLLFLLLLLLLITEEKPPGGTVK